MLLHRRFRIWIFPQGYYTEIKFLCWLYQLQVKLIRWKRGTHAMTENPRRINICSKSLKSFIISPQDDIYRGEKNILIGTMYTWGMDIKNICALNLESLHPRAWQRAHIRDSSDPEPYLIIISHQKSNICAPRKEITTSTTNNKIIFRGIFFQAILHSIFLEKECFLADSDVDFDFEMILCVVGGTEVFKRG